MDSDLIMKGIAWLNETYGEDWVNNEKLDDLNMNSSNLHILALVSDMDYNLWLIKTGEDWMFEHGFTYEGDEDELEEFSNLWEGLITTLQFSRRDKSGDDSRTTAQEIQTKGTEDGTGLSTGQVGVDNERSGDQGAIGASNITPIEHSSDAVQRSGSTLESPNTENSKHILPRRDSLGGDDLAEFFKDYP